MDREISFRQLLFALFARRLRLSSQGPFFTALARWADHSDQDIGEFFEEEGLITPKQKKLVQAMVDDFEKSPREGKAFASGEPGESVGDDGSQLHPTVRIFPRQADRREEDGADPEDDERLLEHIPLEFPGHYEIRRQLGLGGQARVLLAYDHSVGREIALKELLTSTDPGVCETEKGSQAKARTAALRFLREAKITGTLEHPNIVPVYELGQRADGTLYYTMRHVRGTTLSLALSGCRHLTDRMKLLGHFLDLCNAIAYAHSQEVVHRDIKPANVMVGEFGETVLLDWGIAKVRGTEDTRGKVMTRELTLLQKGAFSTTLPGVALGTPSYMSPEQASGKIESIDERSDIWGLGAVLYEILTGEPPFDATDSRELLHNVRHARLTPVTKRCPQAPAELVAIAEKALRKNKDHRYQSAKDLAEDVSAFMTGARVEAYEYSSWELLKRFASKNKRIIAVVSLFVVTILASLVVVTLSYRNEIQARRNEAQARGMERQERLKAHYHLAQAYTQQAESLLEQRMYLSGRIHAAASLIYNPANPGSPHFSQAFASSQPESEIYLVDAASQLYRSEHRLLSGLEQTFRMDEVVMQVVFSPDGKLLAAGDKAGWLRVWSTSDYREVFGLRLENDEINTIAVSPGGDRLAAGTAGGRIHIWKNHRPEPVLTIDSSEEIKDIAFSADGRLLLCGDKKGRVLLRDTTTGRTTVTLKSHADRVGGVAVSPDGRWWASGSWDKTARIYDAAEGSEPRILSGHMDAVHRLSFSPDSTRLVTTSYDKTVRVWQVDDGLLLHTLMGHTEAVYQAMFSSDGRWIVTAGLDRTIRLWDAASGKPVDGLEAHRDVVVSVGFSPDGSHLASGSHDRSVKLWKLAAKDALIRLEHEDWVYGLDFSKDTKLVASGSWDRSVRLWSMDGRLLNTLQGHTDGVFRVAFSPDGSRLASAGFDGWIHMWDVANGRSIARIEAHQDRIYDLAFSPDGRLFASGGRDKKVRVWDAQTAEQVKVLGEHAGWVFGVAFSPDGRYLASTCYDKMTRIWEVATWELVRELAGHSDWVAGLAFSHDGRRLATSGKDKQAIIWDLASGDQLQRFGGHKQWVNCVAFSPDDRRVVTAGDDRLVVVWDVARGKPVLRLRASGGVTEARFTPDGKWLAITDYDTIVMYPLHGSTTRADPRTLQADCERAAGARLVGFDLKVDPGG